MERVLDPALPETVLSLVERAARDWRQQVLDDLGGLDAVSATKRALLDAATGSMILLASLDAYVFELAGQGGLANRKHRRVERPTRAWRSTGRRMRRGLPLPPSRSG
jgi:hypothetical protein